MNDTVFYGMPGYAAVHFACQKLREEGHCVVPEPCKAVTHVLLPVPGGNAFARLQELRRSLRDNVTLIGGRLQGITSALDLLEDEQYLAQNAAITAEAALRIAGNNLPVCIAGCPMLVIGWGRIGKCLARLLQHMGAAVTVASRRPEQRACLLSLGYRTADPRELPPLLSRFRVIFNTVPHLLLDENTLLACREDCVLIDLASVAGMEGERVITARGLPGRDLPEASGELIARTVLRLLQQKGDLP